MNTTDLYQLIVSRWEASQRFELLAGLRKAPTGASTGTQGWLLTWEYLKMQETDNPDAYVEIADLIVELRSVFRADGIQLS